MATTPIQPGVSDGYQIVFLPDGSLIVTQFETLAANDVLEWDDEFVTTGGGVTVPVFMSNYLRAMGA